MLARTGPAITRRKDRYQLRAASASQPKTLRRHQRRDPGRPVDPGVAFLARQSEHERGRACAIDQLALALLQSEQDAAVAVRPSMGGGHLVEHEPVHGRPYHFQRSWIKQDLHADPANLRIMHVEGDSMMPTLHDGDIVLVDLGRRSPTPPGIFVLNDRRTPRSALCLGRLG
jgi:phage repressor protein C with HTH and peptisase S24 domain